MAKILRLPQDLALALDILQNGQVIGIPTETVYGLAGRIDSKRALELIFQLKHRPATHPLIVHVGQTMQSSRDLKKAKLIVDTHPLIDRLIKTFWPGPLTILTAKHPDVSPRVTGGSSMVAIRQPRHQDASILLAAAGPLAAPSANRFGHTSPTTAEAIELDVDVIDGGPCTIGIESTLVLVHQTSLEIMRPGIITTEALEQLAPVVTSHHTLQAPGSLPHHYAPRKPLFVTDTPMTGAIALILLNGSSKLPAWQQSATIVHTQILSEDGDSLMVGRKLYTALRTADASCCDSIVIEPPDTLHGPLKNALCDRLKRAKSDT